MSLFTLYLFAKENSGLCRMYSKCILWCNNDFYLYDLLNKKLNYYVSITICMLILDSRTWVSFRRFSPFFYCLVLVYLFSHLSLPLLLEKKLLKIFTNWIFNSNNVCMYVCMYEGWATIRSLHHDQQWSIVLPLLINPLLILRFEWNVGLYLWGRHNCHLVP
jgi:hypothetical protein